MIPRLQTLWFKLQSSLWPLPLGLIAIACGLAYVVLNFNLDFGEPVWFLFSGSGKQAPQFLAHLLTAMITMATLAISITMVVLTLAAQQLGPRLIRNFMRNRRTQTALGLFIGTVVYLLLVLRSAYSARNSVPNLAVTGGTLLVLICVVVLLFFLHHLARSIVADNVIEAVGKEFDEYIARIRPERRKDISEAHGIGANAPVRLDKAGYVQAIDYDAILRATIKANAAVALTVHAGQHCITDSVIATVSPPEKITDALRDSIRDSFVVGHERTAVQDLEYSIQQLVEIALRALSPGINDIFTALTVVDRLTVSIGKIMKQGIENSTWQDKEGRTRLTGPISTLEGIVDAAFNQIRQNSFGKPAILIHLAGSLGQLLLLADETHRPALEKQLRLVLDAGRRTIADEADLQVLEQRVRSAKGESGPKYASHVG